jgi:hypothetical protein
MPQLAPRNSLSCRGWSAVPGVMVLPMSGTPRRAGTAVSGLPTCDPRRSPDPICTASRAGGGKRQAWRRGIERDHISVADQDADRTTAWSHQLAQAHTTLRKQLQNLQTNLGSAQGDGGGLLAHCLALCSALGTHHEGEDAGMFAELLRVRPDLQRIVTNLAEDHQMIAGILNAVRDLASEAACATSERREAIRRELHGLAAIMESHFGYEERAISAALDGAVEDTGWSTPVFGLGA